MVNAVDVVGYPSVQNLTQRRYANLGNYGLSQAQVGNEAQGDVFELSTENNNVQAQPKDGNDDGSIGFGSALFHTLKGGVKFFTNMFTDENGNFSIGQTLKTGAAVAGIAAATCIPVVGPFVVPVLMTYGMVDGGRKVANGLLSAMKAKTDSEAEQAWEKVGNGATEGTLSYFGYKKSGGFSKALNKNTVPEEVEVNKPNSREITENIETSNANARSRGMVEDALRDTPSEEDIAQYHEEMAYKPAPAEDVAAAEAKGVKFVENEGQNAAQSVGDADGASSLADVKASMEASKGIKNGTYEVEYAEGKVGKYTVEDGKIVKAEVPELSGKISDIKLEKHYTKYDILNKIAQQA